MTGTDHPVLYSRYMSTGKPHWINGCPAGLRPDVPFDCGFRYQHSDPQVNCRLTVVADDRMELELEQPQRAVAVGQYAVLYVGDVCLGSATITHVGPTEYHLQRTETGRQSAADIVTSRALVEV